MIRKVTLNLNNSNAGKINHLDNLMDESLRVLNYFVDILWEEKTFKGKFLKQKCPDTWLSVRLQQCLGKQALEAVKSQRKRHKKTKPILRKPTLNLDERFLSFQEDSNSFDFWIHLGSLGNRLILNLPSRKHNHFNRYREAGWTLKKSGRLRKLPNGWFLDLYFEKEEPPKIKGGKRIGIDVGYKKLAVASDGQVVGKDLEKTYEKISRKRQGSKAFKRALKERDNKINEELNKLDLSKVRSVVMENLKNVKKGSKGKIHKKFNSKLQRWTYPKVLEKLSRVCEETGKIFVMIDPSYTSQTCSLCGVTDKSSRSGEKFVCASCGYSDDADFNASKNICNKGTYSSLTL